jgi:ubiquinone/menaquinone biosynthesis C-methylase UbiE
VLVVARPEADPVPALRAHAGGVRLPGDRWGPAAGARRASFTIRLLGGFSRHHRRALRKVGRRLVAAGGHRSRRGPTVAQGWETYARRHRDEERLGDEWNDPATLGIDVASSDQIVPYLDRVVFGPFLGACDVILEIGPGAGRFTEVLLPRCERLIAVDTSKTMLELLRERFPGDDRIEYHLSRGRALENVADGSVDAGFSYGVFVHLQHWDIFNYLLELHRVLRPGGKGVLQHSNTFSELGWEVFRREVPRQLNRHKLPFTFVLNTPEVMREFVTRAGLECVDTLTDVVRRDCITLLRKPAA